MTPLRQWLDSAATFSMNGFRIAYWTSADIDPEQPWLLLIHGFPTSSWDWSAIWDSLTERFNIAALDMLGFGFSDKPASIRYTIMAQADLQEALLAHLGVSQTHILAHDYGNTVTQELLARDTEGALSFALKSVCFLNGGLFPEQHRPLRIQKIGLSPLGPLLAICLRRGALRRSFNKIFGENTKPSAEEIRTHWKLIRHNNGNRIFHRLLRYIREREEHRERWVGALMSSRAPLRLIVGGQDPISGEHLYHYYLKHVPDADAVLFPDIGHYPQTEAPARTVSAYTAFYESLNT